MELAIYEEAASTVQSGMRAPTGKSRKVGFINKETEQENQMTCLVNTRILEVIFLKGLKQRGLPYCTQLD